MRERYVTLDGIRGLAAIYVAAMHAPDWFGPYTPANAFLAVDLFFALSGFVLAASYSERLGSGLSTWTFFKMRMVRLYPLYFIGLLPSIVRLVASLIARGGLTDVTAKGWLALGPALLMLPAPSLDPTQTLYPLNVPAWSLLFEILINVVFAATFSLWTKRNLVIVLVITGVLMIVAQEHGGSGHNWATLYYGVLRVGYSFPAGVLVYQVLAEQRPVPRVPALACLAAFPLLLLLPAEQATLLCVLVAFPVLVALAAQARVPRYLAVPSLVLGSISYGLYVLHSPLYEVVRAFLRATAWAPNGYVVGTGVLILASLLCWLLEKYVDVPVRAHLTRLFVSER